MCMDRYCWKGFTVVRKFYLIVKDSGKSDISSPVRTIGTAMMIYHKFHLINPISEFNSNVSTKVLLNEF